MDKSLAGIFTLLFLILLVCTPVIIIAVWRALL